MYKLIQNKEQIVGVTYEKDNVIYTIPMSDDNTDYQAYLAWVAEGNQPTPADEVTK